MAQTALTKAIEQIKSDSKIEIRPDIYRDAVNDVVKILTDLLPYERETIEAAYRQGDADAMKENMGDLGDRLYRSETDYFTKTYNQ
jgi:hypothetical protein